MRRTLKIGTRRSPLAMAQTTQFVAQLCADNQTDIEVDIIGMHTRGDKILDKRLAEIGGKGLFTEELEQALLAGALDLVVHSLKDLPTTMPDGLMLGCVPAREDPHDVLVVAPQMVQDDTISVPQSVEIDDVSMDVLAYGTLVGSASLRRVAQLLAVRPDLKITDLRGNIGTRMKKLSVNGSPQATLLAAAGLNRLQAADADFKKQNPPLGFYPLAFTHMLPAPAQGALGIQCRRDDTHMLELLAPLECVETRACITAERSYLEALAGSCITPLAALACINGTNLTLTTRLLSEDGLDVFDHVQQGSVADAREAGAAAAYATQMAKPHLLPRRND